jgi:hypothetical protein
LHGLSPTARAVHECRAHSRRRVDSGNARASLDRELFNEFVRELAKRGRLPA